MKYTTITVTSFGSDSPFDPACGNVFFWNTTDAMEQRAFNITEDGLVQLKKGPSTDFLFCNVQQTHDSTALNGSTRYLLSYRDGHLGVMRYDPPMEVLPGLNRIDNGVEMSVIIENTSYRIKPEDNDLEIAINLDERPILLIGRFINRLSPFSMRHLPIEAQEDIIADVLQNWMLAHLPKGKIMAVKLIEVRHVPR